MNELYVFADIFLTNQEHYFAICAFILKHTEALTIEKLIASEIAKDKEDGD